MTEPQGPSREEDRPSKTMTEQRSSSSEDDQFFKELKNLFMEHCTRMWQADFFLESVSPHTLEAMSLLDSLDDLETGASLYSGPGLFTSLLHEVSSEKREEWVHKEGRAVLQNPIMQTKLDQELDRDLNAVGITDLMGPSVRLMQKAKALISYQINLSMQKPGQLIGSPEAFLVTLTTLIGGHGGLPKESNLYFEYRTTFPVFIIILRDATKLSTIPPIDFDEKGFEREELSYDAGSDNTSQTSSTYDGRSVRDGRVGTSDKDSDGGRESSSPEARKPRNGRASKDSPDPLPKPRSKNACGYTIADGTWLYRFMYNGQSGNTAYIEIKDEPSYITMINNFKGVISKYPSRKYRVNLIHSMDRTASKRWKEKECEDERAEQNFRETCRRELADAFGDAADEAFYEDNIGESYMEWLKKDIARQKQQQQQDLQGKK